MDFNAPWCAPCRSQEPILDILAQNFEGKAVVASMNVDENRDIAARLGIMGIPMQGYPVSLDRFKSLLLDQAKILLGA